MRFIGQKSHRLDAAAKVTGEAVFPGDLSMDGMSHMKVLFARRPHARIVSLDTTRAEALPGVLAVLTAKDVPVNSFGIAIFDQPVLCEDVVRSVGDRVALVVAESEPIAAKAITLIDVIYEDLPILDNPEAALAPGAPNAENRPSSAGCPEIPRPRSPNQARNLLILQGHSSPKARARNGR